jgi:hypothetical protein
VLLFAQVTPRSERTVYAMLLGFAKFLGYPSRRYKVDIKKLALVELPKPDRLFKGGTNYRKRPMKPGKRKNYRRSGR